jgi:hypothetical protein
VSSSTAIATRHPRDQVGNLIGAGNPQSIRIEHAVAAGLVLRLAPGSWRT